MRIAFPTLALVLSTATAACAQQQQQQQRQQQRPVEIAPNAPRDRPVAAVYRCQMAAAIEAMKPYVERARATWPDAWRRFLAGLPAHHTMFVTTRLHDTSGRMEQVFVAVDSIVGARIVGRIGSAVAIVPGYRRGQRYELDERDLVDWMVARPDGSEEGNVVGNFLDTYTPPASCGDAKSAT